MASTNEFGNVVLGKAKSSQDFVSYSDYKLKTKNPFSCSTDELPENRAQKKFANLEVLNSYYLAKDGKHYFYEVILVDPSKPEISKNKDTKWLIKKTNQNRVQRGLTSAGKKSRGLRSKNPMNKSRPSVRAGMRRGK